MSSSSRNWRGGAVPSRPTSNVIYFNELDRSKPLCGWQEPDLSTPDVRAAFRSLR